MNILEVKRKLHQTDSQTPEKDRRMDKSIMITERGLLNKRLVLYCSSSSRETLSNVCGVIGGTEESHCSDVQSSIIPGKSYMYL